MRHLQPILDIYLREVEVVYSRHTPCMLVGWKGLEVETIPFMEISLPERCASNVLAPNRGDLANHLDRPMAYPGVLSRSTPDPSTPYLEGGLLLTTGFFLVDYGERDLLLLWGDEVSHAVITPAPTATSKEVRSLDGKPVLPLRASFFHFTRKGRHPPKHDASQTEKDAWKRATYGLGDPGLGKRKSRI